MGDLVLGEHSCYFPRGPGGESAHREGHIPALRAAAAHLEEGVGETGLSGHFRQQPRAAFWLCRSGSLLPYTECLVDTGHSPMPMCFHTGIT